MPEIKNTYRGEPVAEIPAWVVLVWRRWWTGQNWQDTNKWFPIHWTVGATRAEAIRRYEGPNRGYYQRRRRRGLVRAVRCRIVVDA